MLHPLVVVRLQVAVDTTVRVLFVLATKTLPGPDARATAAGPDPEPVETELAVAKFDGLAVLPSLSTLRVLLDLLATYSVPVDGSTVCATGLVPVDAAILPLMLQPCAPWSPEATKIDCPSAAAAWKSVFSEFW